jgi:hypothetical protein
MLAFADWSSTGGTHYQVHYFSDVSLPELACVASQHTYYGTPFGSLCVKKDTVALSKLYKKVCKLANTGHKLCLQYRVGIKASFGQPQLLG